MGARTHVRPFFFPPHSFFFAPASSVSASSLTVSILQLSPNNCRFSSLFLDSCLPHPYYSISSNLPSEASLSWARRQCQYLSATCELCCLRSHGTMRPPSLLTLGTHMTLLGQWNMSRSNVWHSQGSNQHPFSKTIELITKLPGKSQVQAFKAHVSLGFLLPAVALFQMMKSLSASQKENAFGGVGPL